MAQTTNSKPAPAITFRVNAKTLGYNNAVGHPVTSGAISTTSINSALPNRITTTGNETTSEAEAQNSLRTVWLPGKHANIQGQRTELAFNGLASIAYMRDGDEFVAYGLQAVYIKDTYTTGDNPVLTVIDTDWSGDW